MTPTISLVPPVFLSFTVGAIWHCIHAMFGAKQMFTTDSLMVNLKMAVIIPDVSHISVATHPQYGTVLQNFTEKNVQKKGVPECCVLLEKCSPGSAMAPRWWEVGELCGQDMVHHQVHHSRDWVDTMQAGGSSTYSHQVLPREGECFMTVTAGNANGSIEQEHQQW